MQDYSRDDITLLYGTTNLMQDVKNVYRREFDAALHEYNVKQTRPENRTGTIEQLSQNVEAAEKRIQLMGVKTSRNFMH